MACYDLAGKESHKKMLDFANFNRCHCDKLLCNLSPGEQVWVMNAKTPGSDSKSETQDPTLWIYSKDWRGEVLHVPWIPIHFKLIFIFFPPPISLLLQCF